MGYIGRHETSRDSIGVPVRTWPDSYGIHLHKSASMARSTLLIDGVAITLLSIASGALYHLFAFGGIGEMSVHAATGVLVAVMFCGAIKVIGGSNNLPADSNPSGQARVAVLAWLATFLFLTAVAFSLKIGAAFSRGAILTFLLAGLPVVVTTRVYLPRLLAKTLLANNQGVEIIIAAPRGDQTLPHLSRELRAQGTVGVHIIEFDGNCDTVRWPDERKQLLRRLIETAKVAGECEIFVLSSTVVQERIASILSGLRLVPRAVHIVPSDTMMGLFGLPVRHIGHTVAIETQRAPMSRLSHALKRLLDITVAGSALLFLLPAFAVVAVAIKLDSPGPVFFLQRRNGYRGKPFRIYKFRSMCVLEDGHSVTQAGRDDKRVTKIGRWLRKSSFDELPQLLNVLKGDMSLVGPRPHAIAHDELYAKLIENYELRHHVKPGLTGWAQVNGLRGETPTVDLMFRRIEHDLWYAANCSVRLDFKILVLTAFAVLRQDNAY